MLGAIAQPPGAGLPCLGFFTEWIQPLRVMLRNRNISCSPHDCWLTRPPSSLARRARPGRWLGGGAVGRVSLDSDCGAHGPGPSGGLLILGSQILHVPLDPPLPGVATELLALPGGEEHSCHGADAPVGQLVAYHSALRNFLGDEGHAAERGDVRRPCRGNVVGTQGQEQEASYDSRRACHVLESRGGSSGLEAGVQEERGWGQGAQFLTECPKLPLPFIGAARRNRH